jgi:hypothetical protein
MTLTTRRSICLTGPVADRDGTIYAFGDTFSSGDVVTGIHVMHMNQGNGDAQRAG